MTEHQPNRFTFNLTHCYLEVARGVMTTIHHPSCSLDDVLAAQGPNPLANAILALCSVSVVHSFLAIESFVNYQLFRIWERRGAGSAEANRFVAELGNVAAFEKLKSHRKARELSERLKTLCRILGYPPPHESIPDTWCRFNELVETSRHFLVHPYPDPVYFQSHMKRIMTQTHAGAYVKVVEETLGYLYARSGKSPPPWLTQSTLLRFRGVDLLVAVNGPSNPPLNTDAQQPDPPRIQDIPSIREALKQIRGMSSMKAAMPLLKPFLRLLGVDVARIAEALRNVDRLLEQIEELSTLPDRFNDRFSERGWIIYDYMNLDVARKAIDLADAGDYDAAERELVSYYSPEEVRRQLKSMVAVAAFKPRMRLAEKAADDYEAGRFHACVPVVLALMDGLVSELSEARRGFFAEGADLTAWDCIAAHDKGLNALARILQKGRRKTNTEQIAVPYRHGIMHGMDLGYDNDLVAAKSWAALFAVRDWSLRAERGQLNAPEAQAEASLRDVLRQLEANQECKRQLEEWRPREIAVGTDIPSTGPPEVFGSGTPERHLVEFLQLWRGRNYGGMAGAAGVPCSGAASVSPAAVRDAFQNREIQSSEILAVKDQAAAVSEITVARTIRQQGVDTHDTQTYRLICTDCRGDPAVRTMVGSTWAIVNWSL